MPTPMKAVKVGAKTKSSVMKAKGPLTTKAMKVVRKTNPTRGGVDKKEQAATKKATTMTREQWTASQKAEEGKWPLPAFLEKGTNGTHYRDETFELMCRMQDSTKIAYKPHAKAPGSKSHVRYESYSKATTAGQALSKGSYPQDWCWDYEHGYLKVLGPLRVEPIDIDQSGSYLEDKLNLTEVDKAVYRWYRKELCKKLGLSLPDLSKALGGTESTMMRAHRLVAQREAKAILETTKKEKRMVSDAELTKVLSEWRFDKNITRLNVMQKGQTWINSDTAGLQRDRIGDIHVTRNAAWYPEVVMVINRWLTDRMPADCKSFGWTSLNINKDYAGAIHRDGNNFGPSMISAFGNFTGGKLNYFSGDDRTKSLDEVKKQKHESLDLSNGLALFNGNSAHCVDDFEGNRYSIVYFTMSFHGKMKPEARKDLTNMGFNVPDPDADPYVLLRAPLDGRKGAKASTGSASDRLPACRYWPKKALDASKKRKAA